MSDDKMLPKIINVKIQRFDQLKESIPYYQDYEVPLEKGMSVLDVLIYIYENIDSTLAYYNHAACRRGVCVRCTLKVNEKVVISCQTEATDDMILTPRRGEIVRDLVVLPNYRKSKNLD